MIKKFFLKQIYKSLLNKFFNPILFLNIKPQPIEIKPDDRCLVIAPHPDDESIGCGGTLLLYPNNFDVVSLTHGDENDIRYTEMYNAMKYAGIKNVKMLKLKDKDVISGQKEFNKLDISNYDYIFIPYIFDQHKDHKAVSLLLFNKLKKCNFKTNLKIAYYEVWSTINVPQYYADITNVIENKKIMINFHKSQVKEKDYAQKILGLNSYRGMINNILAIECFSIISIKDFKKLISEIILEN